jgi:hypothetical protein
MKALITILRETGAAIIRVPLLWLFSVVALPFGLTNFLALYLPAQRNSLLLINCIGLLLFPVLILGTAGQIRVVQLYYEGMPISISQVIRHGARRFWSLTGVYLITMLIILILAIILWFVVRSLLPQLPRTSVLSRIFYIATITANMVMYFAQRGIVISDLSVKASLPIVFRVLRKDALTVLLIVIVFGLLRYFVNLTYLKTALSFVWIIIYILVLLVIEVVQSTIFTLIYIHFMGETQPGIPAIQAEA